MTLDATRAAGLARLADFVPRAGRAYAAEREVVEVVREQHSLDAETAALIPDAHRIIGLRNVLAHG